MTTPYTTTHPLDGPSAVSRRVAYVLTGVPGAGKTSAVNSLLARHPRLAHFGVKSQALALIAEGHPEVVAMRHRFETGELAEDAEVRRLLEISLQRLSAGQRQIIIEGYPRSPQQFHDLDAVLKASSITLGGLIEVEISDELSRLRTATRTACEACGRPSPPVPHGELCGACGATMRRRADDDDLRAGIRLRDHRLCQESIHELFERDSELFRLDGTRAPEAIADQIASVLGLPPGPDTGVGPAGPESEAC
ncbi:nucleoside monophosphate kinase [Streptomyces sp. LN549]|uniref:nucleoside monophosphate kinase n=1 Tax=Streptomyces sp. LN549 TaxID=3112979 RepID=UPI0037112E33